MISAILVVVALLQWLTFLARMLYQPANRTTEKAFLLSTIAVAVVWTSVAGESNFKQRDASTSSTITKRSCASVREGMPDTELRESMGIPSRKVTEIDTRGPGAEAWVYESAGCVAHVLDAQVRSVDYQ